MGDWTMQRYPLGVERTSADGRYRIWSAKPGTGHMLRYPDDPMRHVVFLVEGDAVRLIGRYHKLVYAKSHVEQDRKGVLRR